MITCSNPIRSAAFRRSGTSGSQMLSRTTSRHIVATLRREGRSASTIRNAITPLQTFFRHAREHELVSVDPTEGVILSKPKRKAKRIIGAAA